MNNFIAFVFKCIKIVTSSLIVVRKNVSIRSYEFAQFGYWVRRLNVLAKYGNHEFHIKTNILTYAKEI